MEFELKFGLVYVFIVPVLMLYRDVLYGRGVNPVPFISFLLFMTVWVCAYRESKGV